MFSDILRKLREENALTQRQVAVVLGIDRSTYAYYELGRSHPDINGIKKLATLYKISIDELLEYDQKSRQSDCDADAFKLHDSHFVYNNSSASMPNYVSDLSRNEQTLVLLYRLLSESQQEKAIQLLQNLCEN